MTNADPIPRVLTVYVEKFMSADRGWLIGFRAWVEPEAPGVETVCVLKLIWPGTGATLLHVTLNARGADFKWDCPPCLAGIRWPIDFTAEPFPAETRPVTFCVEVRDGGTLPADRMDGPRPEYNVTAG